MTPAQGASGPAEDVRREAREVAAAEEIRVFYGDSPPPLPEGVIAVTPGELAAADDERW